MLISRSLKIDSDLFLVFYVFIKISVYNNMMSISGKIKNEEAK